MNRRIWILSPLLSVGFVLTLFFHISHAALLKDIRVGEYRGFTRIVFELDTPTTEPEKIEPQFPGRLAISFTNTSADLIRKIPIERSPHVKDVRIWEKGNRLTAILTFEFNSYSQKSFSLTDPPRLVLDVKPLANAPDTVAKVPPQKLQNNKNGISAAAPSQNFETTRHHSNIPPGSEAQKKESHSDKDNSASLPGDIIDHETPTEVPSNGAVAVNGDQRSQAEPEPQTSEAEKNTEKFGGSSAMRPKYTAHSSAKRTGRLQFYLVVFLVFITIAILVLLLLMLLVKHPWIENRSSMIAKGKPKNKNKPKSLPKGGRNSHENFD